MAEELGGLALRSRYLSDAGVVSAPAVIWVNEADIRKVRRYHGVTPQILDVINPRCGADDRVHFWEMCRAFRFLIVNTEATREYLGPVPEHGWKSWVVPHHHCNRTGYVVPEDRIERPRVVGYIGEREHLHDEDLIEAHIKKLGLVFLRCGSSALSAYEQFDIGISWTRPEEIRDRTRSNQKMVNFVAHGIPCVVPEYDSYRAVDAEVGGGSCILRHDLESWLDGLSELAGNESLRRAMWSKAVKAQEAYSRRTIGQMYRVVIAECQAVNKEEA